MCIVMGQQVAKKEMTPFQFTERQNVQSQLEHAVKLINKPLMKALVYQAATTCFFSAITRYG